MQILSAIEAKHSQMQSGAAQSPVTQQSPRDATTGGTTGGTTDGASSPPANTPDQLTSQSTFLQLLVAQIKNQDPLNPTDSIQFIGQLVQFSQLEQLLGINKGIQTLVGGSTATSTAPVPTRSGSQTN